MKDWDELLRLVWSFGEEGFKRYVRGFLVDSKRLAREMDALDLQIVSQYVPEVFWRRLREKDLRLYAIDVLLEYARGGASGEASLEGAESLLILNSLFWRRFKRSSMRKSDRLRPREDYYLQMGAFFYRMSYLSHGSLVYRLMDLHYRVLVEELRKLKA